MIWTASQRRVLAFAAAILLAALAIAFALNPRHIDDPPRPDSADVGRLTRRLDPNTASAGDLAALPVIGPALAGRIIETRTRLQAERPGEKPFRALADLDQVKGIGEAKLRQLEPYLDFGVPYRTEHP